MLKRHIIEKLEGWSRKPNRKPLVLRGARQVGKTTAVKIFASQFDVFIKLNLEKIDELSLFNRGDSFEKVLEAICFIHGIQAKEIVSKRTLIFIDEIQNSPEAVALLRYFYEDAPHLFVIAAGSLLENILDTHISFPVGRVEFLQMHPFTFEEYLWAMGESAAAEMLTQTPVHGYAHQKMRDLFKRYTLIGGMPEVVDNYREYSDLLAVNEIYESLLIAYIEDIEKYSNRDSIAPVLRHIITTAFSEVGSRIKFGGFGNSNYSAKMVKEAFAILQKAFLFQVIYPTTEMTLPIVPNIKKAPRLHALDTGLIIFFTKMQKVLFASKDISSVYSGKIIEHIVGQEIYATSNSPLFSLNYWVREKSQSNAEIDYVVPYNNYLIPVEVKTGASGRLRSLHSFVDAAPHQIAVRIYGGEFSVEDISTITGKPFKLLNIPHYHASRIESYLEKFV